jgi:hypothetical protein
MNKSALMFLVLALCGTACILGGLVTAALLVYPSIPIVIADAKLERIFSLAFLAVCPSFITILLGGGLLLMGIRIGRKGD